MKTKRGFFALLLIVAALSFGVGALSDSGTVYLRSELQYRAGVNRNLEDWFGGEFALLFGPGSDYARGYFRGRAEGYEDTLALLNRLEAGEKIPTAPIAK